MNIYTAVTSLPIFSAQRSVKWLHCMSSLGSHCFLACDEILWRTEW